MMVSAAMRDQRLGSTTIAYHMTYMDAGGSPAWTMTEVLTGGKEVLSSVRLQVGGAKAVRLHS